MLLNFIVLGIEYYNYYFLINTLITSLLFIYTTRRYYRLNNLIKSSDWFKKVANDYLELKKLVKLGYLKKIKVIKKIFSVNLRKDYYLKENLYLFIAYALEDLFFTF